MRHTLLYDQLIAFTNKSIDRFVIQCDEIPLVAAWLSVRGLAYDITTVKANGDTWYEVRRDYARLHF